MQKELNNILDELIQDTYALINVMSSIDTDRFIPLRRLLLNFESDPWWDSKRNNLGANNDNDIPEIVPNILDVKEHLDLLTPEEVIRIFSGVWLIDFRVYDLVHSDRINNLEIPEYIINGLTMISDESHDLFLKYANQCDWKKVIKEIIPEYNVEIF